MSDRFLDTFLGDQAKELEALGAAVGAKLDRSYESLDIVEDWYQRVLGSAEEKRATARVARYVGATLAEHAKGTWVPSTESDEPEAAIKLPGLGTRTFDPASPVLGYRRRRIPGLLRESTERWDLALRRATLANLLANAEHELTQLTAAVAKLTGQRVAELDGGEQSVGLVEDAIKSVASDAVPHERRRQLRQRAVLFLGNVYAEAVGDGEWSVMADPRNLDLGELRIAGWSPASAVFAINTKTPSGALHRALERQLKAAR